jgi:hypothetical protein
MIVQNQGKPKRAKQVYVRWLKDCRPVVVIKNKDAGSRTPRPGVKQGQRGR